MGTVWDVVVGAVVPLAEASIGLVAGVSGVVLAAAVGASRRRAGGVGRRVVAPGPAACGAFLLAVVLALRGQAPWLLVVAVAVAVTGAVLRARTGVAPVALTGVALALAAVGTAVAAAGDHRVGAAALAVGAVVALGMWCALLVADDVVAAVAVVAVPGGLYLGVPDTELVVAVGAFVVVPAALCLMAAQRRAPVAGAAGGADLATVAVLVVWLVPEASLGRAPLLVGGWGIVATSVVLAAVAVVLGVGTVARVVGGAEARTDGPPLRWPRRVEVAVVLGLAAVVIARLGMVRVDTARAVVVVAAVLAVQAGLSALLWRGWRARLASER